MTEWDTVAGLNIKELLEVRAKLDVLGIQLSDVKEFLDRDKTQLFSEMKNKIRVLEKKLEDVRKISGVPYYD